MEPEGFAYSIMSRYLVKCVKGLAAEERQHQAERQSDHAPCHPYANVTVASSCILAFHTVLAIHVNLVFFVPVLLSLFGPGSGLPVNCRHYSLYVDTQRRTIVVVSRYGHAQMLFKSDIN